MAGPFFHTALKTFNGVQTVNEEIVAMGISPTSNVLVAATEIDGLGQPFIGGAAIQVMDIAPAKDGVAVRVNVLFNTPITIRLTYAIWP